MKTSFRTKNLIYSLLLLPSIFIVPLYQSKSIENSPSTFTMSIDEKFVDYTVEEIATGGAHSGIIINDGTSDHLYTWGYNEYGQLGLGDDYSDEEYSTPHEVIFYEDESLTNPIESTDFEHLSLGQNHSAVVLNDEDGDHLYTWGDNSWGQLGLGDYSESTYPLETKGDTYLSYNTPQEVTSYYSKDNKKIKISNIEDVSLGYQHTAIVAASTLNNEQNIYTWGSNGGGRLGYGDIDAYEDYEITAADKDGTKYFDEPHPVSKTWKKGSIEQISMGDDTSSAVINQTGKEYIYMWGRNYKGQLGIGSLEIYNQNESFYEPEVVKLSSAKDDELVAKDIKQISMNGEEYSSAIVDNKLYTWGLNDLGQLGLGVKDNPSYIYDPDDDGHYSDCYLYPQEVTELSNGNIEQISMGNDHGAAIVDNELYTWGDNSKGELGIKDNPDPTSPQKVNGLPKGDIKQISLGNSFSVALIEDGEDKYLYTWGWNTYDQLGLGDEFDENEYPTPQEAASLIVTPFTQKWYFYLLITIIIIAVLTVIAITTLLIIKAIQKPKIVN